MKKDWMIKQSELDEDQLAVLNATLDKSCVVSGCAGSGKSVLALIKAKRIQEEKGNDYQVIVYTKALASYMNSGREHLELNNGFSYHWEWKKEMPKSAYFIVDEIQDFTEQEVKQFIDATKKNFFFYGDNAQSLYKNAPFKSGKTIDIDEVRFLVSNSEQRPKAFELYRNYRLPLPVARFSYHIGRNLQEFQEQVYKSQENQLPYVLGFNNLEEELQRIIEIIKGQDLTDVAILLPNNTMVQKAYSILTKIGFDSIEAKYEDKEDWRNSVNTLNFRTNTPKLMTYHSAKGLQFETVFLPEVLNDITQDQNALYVAVTRTWKNLYIMYSGLMPSYLASIPKELYLTTESNNDEFEDI